MMKAIWTSSVHVLLGLSLFMQATVSVAGERHPVEPIGLKVVICPFLSYAPYFISLEEGYFQEQGLQVEVVRFARTAEAIPLLAQGKIDVAGGITTVNTLNAMAHGAEVRFVADKGHITTDSCAYAGLVARRDLVQSGKLNLMGQLKGRRFAIDETNFEGYYVEKLLRAAGLSLDDVETGDIPETVMLSAFEKGTIDLAATSEPWITRLSQTRKADMWKSLQQVVPGYQFAYVLFGPNLVVRNPDAGKRFMTAYLKGVRQYNRGKTERNMQIVAKHTSLDRELLRQACWPSIREDGRINERSIIDFQKWAKGKGYLKETISPDRFWDGRFVEYANRILNSVSP